MGGRGQNASGRSITEYPRESRCDQALLRIRQRHLPLLISEAPAQLRKRALSDCARDQVQGLTTLPPKLWPTTMSGALPSSVTVCTTSWAAAATLWGPGAGGALMGGMMRDEQHGGMLQGVTHPP
jgi:hypothetical protein